LSLRPLRRRICQRFADSELAVPLTTTPASLVYKCALASPELLGTRKPREFLLRRRRRAEFAKHAKEEQEQTHDAGGQ